tara:strand:- start:952 stop:1158 length:207 start_codon:yes stop_codon:yes gene_type:complete
MARQATIIGRKGGKWSSVAVGTATEMRNKFKHDSFQGFEQVWILDTSGGHKRKKGSPVAKKAAPKAKA